MDAAVREGVLKLSEVHIVLTHQRAEQVVGGDADGGGSLRHVLRLGARLHDRLASGGAVAAAPLRFLVHFGPFARPLWRSLAPAPLAVEEAVDVEQVDSGERHE